MSTNSGGEALYYGDSTTKSSRNVGNRRCLIPIRP